MREKNYIITMPDGSKWSVPVKVIAKSRAEYYADDFGGDLLESLDETYKDFEADDFEVNDWAQNNMNWEDVEAKATQVSPPENVDYDEGWVNGEKEIK